MLVLDEGGWRFKCTLQVKPSKRALADGSETLKKPGKDTSEQNLRFCVTGYHDSGSQGVLFGLGLMMAVQLRIDDDYGISTLCS